MDTSLRKRRFEQTIASIAPPRRSLFAISQVAFLMGAMEFINPAAAKIMGEAVRSWNQRDGFIDIAIDGIVEQLMEKTGSMDDARVAVEYAAVQMAICTTNILDACSSGTGMPVSALNGIAYSVFDIAPYFGDDSQLYSDSPGCVVEIIESQQENVLKKLGAVDKEGAMGSIEFSRMAGLRLKKHVPV